jgi:anti-sigma factor RsiW
VIHLTLQQLSAFLDGELTEASTELIRRHLSECTTCTVRFARIEAQDEITAKILVDEPDDEFFRGLLESIGSGNVRRVEAPAAPPAPRMTPPAETKATVVPEAKVKPKDPVRVPKAPRSVTAPTPTPQRRAEDVVRNARRVTAGRIAAVIVCILLASVGWVVLHGGMKAIRVLRLPAPVLAPKPSPMAPHSEPRSDAADQPEPESPTSPGAEAPPTGEPSSPGDVAVGSQPVAETEAPVPITTPEPAPAPKSGPKPARKAAPKPEHLVERPLQNVVPVRTIVTETALDPGAPSESAPTPAPTGTPAAPTPAAPSALTIARVVGDATSASLRAARTKDPVAFDDAASAWERAVPMLSTSPEDLAVARRELAQARFQAWAEAPTPARREAAIGAARIYLLYAPPGPERDQAWTWLARLKR